MLRRGAEYDVMFRCDAADGDGSTAVSFRLDPTASDRKCLGKTLNLYGDCKIPVSVSISGSTAPQQQAPTTKTQKAKKSTSPAPAGLTEKQAKKKLMSDFSKAEKRAAVEKEGKARWIKLTARKKVKILLAARQSPQ